MDDDWINFYLADLATTLDDLTDQQLQQLIDTYQH